MNKIMKKLAKILVVFLIMLFVQCRPNYINRYEAKKIALDTLYHKFGKELIINNKPYQVYNKDSVWVIKSFKKRPCKGVTFVVEIIKKEGKIVYVGLNKNTL